MSSRRRVNQDNVENHNEQEEALSDLFNTSQDVSTDEPDVDSSSFNPEDYGVEGFGSLFPSLQGAFNLDNVGNEVCDRGSTSDEQLANETMVRESGHYGNVSEYRVGDFENSVFPSDVHSRSMEQYDNGKRNIIDEEQGKEEAGLDDFMNLLYPDIEKAIAPLLSSGSDPYIKDEPHLDSSPLNPENYGAGGLDSLVPSLQGFLNLGNYEVVESGGVIDQQTKHEEKVSENGNLETTDGDMEKEYEVFPSGRISPYMDKYDNQESLSDMSLLFPYHGDGFNVDVQDNDLVSDMLKEGRGMFTIEKQIVDDVRTHSVSSPVATVTSHDMESSQRKRKQKADEGQNVSSGIITRRSSRISRRKADVVHDQKEEQSKKHKNESSQSTSSSGIAKNAAVSIPERGGQNVSGDGQVLIKRRENLGQSTSARKIPTTSGMISSSSTEEITKQEDQEAIDAGQVKLKRKKEPGQPTSSKKVPKTSTRIPRSIAVRMPKEQDHKVSDDGHVNVQQLNQRKRKRSNEDDMKRKGKAVPKEVLEKREECTQMFKETVRLSNTNQAKVYAFHEQLIQNQVPQEIIDHIIKYQTELTGVYQSYREDLSNQTTLIWQTSQEVVKVQNELTEHLQIAPQNKIDLPWKMTYQNLKKQLNDVRIKQEALQKKITKDDAKKVYKKNFERLRSRHTLESSKLFDRIVPNKPQQILDAEEEYQQEIERLDPLSAKYKSERQILRIRFRNKISFLWRQHYKIKYPVQQYDGSQAGGETEVHTTPVTMQEKCTSWESPVTSDPPEEQTSWAEHSAIGTLRMHEHKLRHGDQSYNPSAKPFEGAIIQRPGQLSLKLVHVPNRRADVKCATQPQVSSQRPATLEQVQQNVSSVSRIEVTHHLQTNQEYKLGETAGEQYEALTNKQGTSQSRNQTKFISLLTEPILEAVSKRDQQKKAVGDKHLDLVCDQRLENLAKMISGAGAKVTKAQKSMNEGKINEQNRKRHEHQQRVKKMEKSNLKKNATEMAQSDIARRTYKDNNGQMELVRQRKDKAHAERQKKAEQEREMQNKAGWMEEKGNGEKKAQEQRKEEKKVHIAAPLKKKDEDGLKKKWKAVNSQYKSKYC